MKDTTSSDTAGYTGSNAQSPVVQDLSTRISLPLLCDTDDNITPVLGDMLALLQVSPTAQRLMEEVAQAEWLIAMAPLNGPDYHLDVPEKRITLDAGPERLRALRLPYHFHTVVFSLCRALRDVWQEKRHGGFDATFTLDGVLMLERVRAADADVMAVLIAWELRVAGFSGLWRHILASDDNDLAHGFAAIVEKAHKAGQGAVSARNMALSSIFTQWHAKPIRVNECDHETLEHLDTLIMLPAHERPVLGNAKPMARDVEILSCLPDRTAYLQGMGGEIVSSPAYAGLADPINQAHFLQLTRDAKAVIVEGVPFRDPILAALIFPNCEPESE